MPILSAGRFYNSDINEVRLVLLYPKHLHMTLSSDFSMQATSRAIQDPCFNRGYSRVMNVSDLYNNTCTWKFKKPLQFSQLEILGTGNFEQCWESITALFNTSQCPYSRCAFNDIFLPQLQGQFGVSLWNDKVYWLGWFFAASCKIYAYKEFN